MAVTLNRPILRMSEAIPGWRGMRPCGCWQGRESAIRFHVSCSFRQGGTILSGSVETSTTFPSLDIDRIVLLPLYRLCGARG